MTRILLAFIAVFGLALVTIAAGDQPANSVLVWSGYGVEANLLAAAVAIGAHLVMAALVYRGWGALREKEATPARATAVVPEGPMVGAPLVLSEQEGDEGDIELIGLRGLTNRARERGELTTARELAQRGLEARPGTEWLEDLLEDPMTHRLKME